MSPGRVWAMSAAAACAGAIVGLMPRPAPAHPAETVEFHYTGDFGPAFWSELSPEWRACDGGGGRQTPIEIAPSRTLPTLTPLQLSLRPTPIDLLNNGHTMQQSHEPGSTLTLDGVAYELLQFHFHTPAEHTIEGVRHAMEQHAVFKDVRTGNLAVIGLLYRIGAENAFLAAYPNLPQKKGRRVTDARTVNLRDSFTSLDSYFAYSGSLTTPPCTEHVTWLVLREPAELSRDQLNRAWRVMGNNFRPTQPRSSSMVVHSTPR